MHPPKDHNTLPDYEKQRIEEYKIRLNHRPLTRSETYWLFYRLEEARAINQLLSCALERSRKSRELLEKAKSIATSSLKEEHLFKRLEALKRQVMSIYSQAVNALVEDKLSQEELAKTVCWKEAWEE